MNPVNSVLESALFLDKPRKHLHSIKLEMKGLFLRRDIQNLTMMSTQEMNYLNSFFNGPELVKLALNKLKCKRILSGSRKLKVLLKFPRKIPDEKIGELQVFPFDFFNQKLRFFFK